MPTPPIDKRPTMRPDWPRDDKGRILSKAVATQMGMLDVEGKVTGVAFDPDKDPRPKKTPPSEPRERDAFPVADEEAASKKMPRAQKPGGEQWNGSGKKRGRPTKEEQAKREKDDFYESIAADDELVSALTGGIKIVFSIVAARYGRHWELTPAEANALGKSYSRVLLKYGLPYQYFPEVLAIGTTAAVLTRINGDRKQEAERIKPVKAEQVKVTPDGVDVPDGKSP